MFKGIREWSGGVLDALTVLADAATMQAVSTDGALEARVAELELGMAKHMAEAEALLMKAQAERKVARNAEERTRYMANQIGDADETGEGGEEFDEEAYRELLESNGAGGPQGGLPQLREGVGRSRADKKREALARKFSAR